MSDEVTYNGTVYCWWQCRTCGSWNVVPKTVLDAQYRLGGFHSCHMGHQWGWKAGAEQEEINVLRRERDRLKQNAAYLNDRIAEEQKRATEAEKKYQRARRRAVAGVCPCCNRTFVNVQRHMATKHKNVVPLEQKANA